ncbi:6-phosphofructokinase [Phytobacter diazotrophicus]|jgi:6-phosphofructokinase 1|uniref:6-phosphofructokinase n=1 Tax=Phytobacter diazotrophicus TaxID=395631 RepID=A0ABN6LWV9_9ENTR|nr:MULTISPECIES: 6-phosphofructokinase [Phytobacter]MBS6740031.1 6-phosphofructokinase [Enterobacteriaceae bacterium]PXW52054.1 6-phosphofructokinase 1 [Grimontella sp. AG753]QIH65904.1 permease [Enterobacteriaceae bacterium A-F18]SLK20297.1 6-phosphofructokinase 1 [Enterobacter sp. NFR05]MBV8873828.1 6-phosphofructokinase [Phytobacter sp.]
MRIGVVISGGDVSGINNFIFQIARLMQADITLFNGGIPGLLEKKHNEIAWRDLVDFSIASIPIITSGRTTRKLVRSEYEIIAKKLRSLRIDVLVMAGGDGSLQFLNTLSEFDVNCFGVGMTIDNDVYGSDYSIGFSTACEQIIKEVSRLRNTGRALPGRVFMVEVLGGYCGELTLQSAIKSNADIALIPECQIPIDELSQRITDRLASQNSVVILCSEGYTREYTPGFQGAIDTMIKQLEPRIGVRIRKTIIGYGLRNGDPTCEEIYQGTIMASEVVRCIQSGMKNKAIIINSSNKPIPIDLISMKKRLVDTEGHHYKLAKQLNII